MRKLLLVLLLVLSFILVGCVNNSLDKNIEPVKDETDNISDDQNKTPVVDLEKDVVITEFTDDVKLQLKLDYLEFYFPNVEKLAEKVKIIGFYGVYNNCVAVMVECDYEGYFTWMFVEKVGEESFSYNNTNCILIYRNHNFYRLYDAYNNGWISDGEVKSIKYLYSPVVLN